MSKSVRGMTLIELMVVIAIIVILATIAVVGWGRYVRSAARADAMAALTDVQVKQERYRYSQLSYASRVQFSSLFGSAGGSLPATSPGGRYVVDVISASTSGFTATATPIGSQTADTECGTFAISQTGPVTSSGYANDVCWKR